MFFNKKKPETQSPAVTHEELLTDELFDLEDDADTTPYQSGIVEETSYNRYNTVETFEAFTNDSDTPTAVAVETVMPTLQEAMPTLPVETPFSGYGSNNSSSVPDDFSQEFEEPTPPPVVPAVSKSSPAVKPTVATMGGFNFPKLATNTATNRPNPQQHGAFSSKQQATISSTVFQEPPIEEPSVVVPSQPVTANTVAESVVSPVVESSSVNLVLEVPESGVEASSVQSVQPQVTDFSVDLGLTSIPQVDATTNNQDFSLDLGLASVSQVDATVNNQDFSLALTMPTESSATNHQPLDAFMVPQGFEPLEQPQSFNTVQQPATDNAVQDDFSLSFTLDEPTVLTAPEQTQDVSFSFQLTEDDSALTVAPAVVESVPSSGTVDSNWMDFSLDVTDEPTITTDEPALLALDDVPPGIFALPAYGICSTVLDPQEEFIESIELQTHHAVAGTPEYTLTQLQPISSSIELTGLAIEDSFATLLQANELNPELVLQDIAVAEQQVAINLPETPSLTGFSVNDTLTLDISQFEETPLTVAEEDDSFVVLQEADSSTLLPQPVQPLLVQAEEEPSFLLDFSEELSATAHDNTIGVLELAEQPVPALVVPQPVVSTNSGAISSNPVQSTNTALVEEPRLAVTTQWPVQPELSVTVVEHNNVSGTEGVNPVDTFSILDDAFDFGISTEAVTPEPTAIVPPQVTEESSTPVAAATVQQVTPTAVTPPPEMISLATVLGGTQAATEAEHEPIIDLSKHKISDYIGSTLPFYDLTLEKIKVLAMAPLQQENSAILYVEIEPFYALFGLLNNQFHLLHAFNTNPITGLSASPQQVFMLNLNATSQTLGDIYELKIGNWHTLLAVTQQHIGLQRISSVG